MPVPNLGRAWWLAQQRIAGQIATLVERKKYQEEPVDLADLDFPAARCSRCDQDAGGGVFEATDDGLFQFTYACPDHYKEIVAGAREVPEGGAVVTPGERLAYIAPIEVDATPGNPPVELCNDCHRPVDGACDCGRYGLGCS